MGIEDIALKTLTFLNHSVTCAGTRFVRFLCEKPCHTSERQRTAANVMRVSAEVDARSPSSIYGTPPMGTPACGEILNQHGVKYARTLTGSSNGT